MTALSRGRHGSARPRWLLALLFALAAMPAWAHQPSNSYLTIHGGGKQLTARWDIALKDLDFLIGLDANADAKLTWGEVKAKRRAIAAEALSHLRVETQGRTCPTQVNDLLIDHHSDGAYAVLKIGLDCPGNVAKLDIRYSLLFAQDPTHRGLLRYTNGATTSTHVLTPDNHDLTLRTRNRNWLGALQDYLIEGIWHIWSGYDHILFVIALLLPAVLVLRGRRWAPAERFLPALGDVLRIVTGFTIAHSITLSLAVLQYIALPSRWVEAGIALSIVVTALDNLFPVISLSRWVVAFAFGLIHGFGFANVLIDLGLSHTTLAISLFGFNIGVEVGQLAVAVLLFPAAFILRRTLFYRVFIFRLGSLATALVAGIWMVERIFDVQILGF